jgi:hypothetical protein
METKTTHGFKLISKLATVAGEKPSPPINGVQQSLFPLRNPRSAFFVSLPEVDHSDFVSLLRNSGPAVVVELRGIPRFDFGPLNRGSIFELFQEQGDIYLDLGTQIEGSDQNFIETRIQKTLQDHVTQQRPILFLTSAAQNPPSLTQAILKWLRQSSEPWEIYEVPQQGAKWTDGITA